MPFAETFAEAFAWTFAEDFAGAFNTLITYNLPLVVVAMARFVPGTVGSKLFSACPALDLEKKRFYSASYPFLFL